MPKRTTGRYESVTAGGEKVDAFIPFDLPPTRPVLAIDGKLERRLREAEQALVRLDLAGEMVPSFDWFIYAFVRKEAVISSQIEGTQASLVDLLTSEAEEQPAPNADIEEVTNYLDALAYARGQLAAKRGLPLSMRLLNEAHKRLMRGVRGSNKQPGDVRRSQNWIGGSRPANAAHVPPAPDKLPQLLSGLERYIHADDPLPALVRMGLLHVQFETIHPYLDGNGRIGRLLVTLLLEHWGLLKAPLLYLSLFFKRHREEYYRRLNLVRLEGDWEGWTDFFLDGVATIADEAVASARDLFNLVSADRARLLGAESASVSALRLFEQLPRHPIVTVASAMKLIDTSKPTATRAIEALAEVGVLVETTGKKRDRSFAYRAYMERLRAGTDLNSSG
ncbi:adenosine monophosphate-protein transferase [Mesorhizobium tianshanense]|uniref:Fic family protein n=1 Tax=Mesorhizobium tianshanense TaxID=39844 RepID=A0A562NRE5_9HYPH|nr:Fic family protein [Mesorhizobium tianshanense]TWI34745.1 Fic family protein [Mesorhizobium tianshanense]GLS40192.1 adenosine monophosphate-protein transferase [Mesorhizobium tianshanense]